MPKAELSIEKTILLWILTAGRVFIYAALANLFLAWWTFVFTGCGTFILTGTWFRASVFLGGSLFIYLLGRFCYEVEMDNG